MTRSPNDQDREDVVRLDGQTGSKVQEATNGYKEMVRK